MKRSRAQSWQRFYEDVVLAGGDWPRPLWRLAVEDALSAALPGSALVNQYRREVAELSKIEQREPGSYRDRRRKLELEEEIEGIIARADRMIRGDPRPGGQHAVVLRQQAAEPRRTLAGAAAATAIGLLIAGGAFAGASYVYEGRLSAHVEDELQRYVADLEQSVARMQHELEARTIASRGEQEQLAALQEELESGMTFFNTALTEGLATMTGLHEAALADLEQRLEQGSGGVGEALTRFQQEARTLDQSFAKARQDLARIEQRLPALSDTVAQLDGQVGEAKTVFANVFDAVSGMQAEVPKLAARFEAESQELQRQIVERQQALGTLDTRIAALQQGIEGSGTDFDSLHKLLTNGVEKAQHDGQLLEAAVEDARKTGAVVAKLAISAEEDIEGLRRLMQEEVDSALSAMAEKADLAVLRGDDVLQRAQSETVRRIEEAGEAALAALAERREQKLAELAAAAEAAQAELDKARASLEANWKEMDQSLSERQNQLLSHVDQYADTMQARVQDLLDAVNVMVAQSGSAARGAVDGAAR